MKRITLSCGHTETVELKGDEVRQSRREKTLHLYYRCSACKQAEENPLPVAAQLVQTMDGDPPVLCGGTPEQNAHADLIRQKRLAELTDENVIEALVTGSTHLLPETSYGVKDGDRTEILEERAQAFLSALWNQPHTFYWLERGKKKLIDEFGLWILNEGFSYRKMDEAVR